MNIDDTSAYQGGSGPPNSGTIRVLPPVDIQGLVPLTLGGEVARWVGFVVIHARWNFQQQINIGGLSWRNHVFVSISEVFNNPDDAGQITLPAIGAAHMSVRSVAPQNGRVLVNGYIDWDRDLNVRISLLIT